MLGRDTAAGLPGWHRAEELSERVGRRVRRPARQRGTRTPGRVERRNGWTSPPSRCRAPTCAERFVEGRPLDGLVRSQVVTVAESPRPLSCGRMTGVQTERADAPDVDPAPQPESPPVVSRDRARRQRGARDEPVERRPRRKFRGTRWFALASLVCVGLLMVMLWQGWETAKEIKGGNRLHQQTNPAKPGYQEEVLATPSRLVGQLDANGHLADMVLLTAPDQKGGNAVFIPSTLVVERDGQTLPLVRVVREGGMAVRRRLDRSLPRSRVHPDRADVVGPGAEAPGERRHAHGRQHRRRRRPGPRTEPDRRRSRPGRSP